MRCISPRRVGFADDGKTLRYRVQDCSKEYPFFKLPCGKCIPCRLEYSSQWGVRAMHEASMHEENSFCTLTYNDESLPSVDKLYYVDFQDFMKRLRSRLDRRAIDDKISYLVCGEFGKVTKRPHWHACLFGYRPDDQVFHRESDSGYKVYTSEFLSDVWGKGFVEFGSVNYESAAYCARYAAKDLVHGRDQDHAFKAIFKTSRYRAIGKSFLEKHYKDIFNYGRCVLASGKTVSIPRYYEKWMKENHWDEYLEYYLRIKSENFSIAEENSRIDEFSEVVRRVEALQRGESTPRPRSEVKYFMLKAKLKLLHPKL